MESDILNAWDCGVTPGFGYGETNPIALQRAVDEMRGAGGGTVYIPTGVYEVAGAINLEISTAASATGTVRISGERSVTLVQSVESNLFVGTDAQDGACVGQVLLEGLAFQERRSRRRLNGRARSGALIPKGAKGKSENNSPFLASGKTEERSLR
jgi:hypothetical protein